jgi:hypothetical protein
MSPTINKAKTKQIQILRIQHDDMCSNFMDEKISLLVMRLAAYLDPVGAEWLTLRNIANFI